MCSEWNSVRAPCGGSVLSLPPGGVSVTFMLQTVTIQRTREAAARQTSPRGESRPAGMHLTAGSYLF